MDEQAEACAAIGATPAQRRLLLCASAPARQTPTTRGRRSLITAIADCAAQRLPSQRLSLCWNTYLTTSVLSSRLWFHRPDQPVQD